VRGVERPDVDASVGECVVDQVDLCPDFVPGDQRFVGAELERQRLEPVAAGFDPPAGDLFAALVEQTPDTCG
jgi:hypothetical protein